MIKTFRAKPLADLFHTGKGRKVPPELAGRILRALDALHRATSLRDLDLPGLRCHPLRGFKPQRSAIAVNGPWRITFEWREGDALAVDLEQYH